MRPRDGNRQGTARTFLGRLRRDTGGNTLAMMAIALVPVSALAGSAVDMARLYVVKVRLQQACDAGVLAGRKFMTDSSSSALDETAKSRATEFFNNNFKSGWMRTTGATSFTPTKTADQQVAGAASTVVPMTVMKMFKAADVTLNVTCEARYDVADSDIMFVLDTTGSMACAPEDTSGCNQENIKAAKTGGGGSFFYVKEKNNSKLNALRAAVIDFDTTMRANADPSTHIRYGFVSYSSSVNVGGIIPPQFLENDSWNYQTRILQGENNTTNRYDVVLSGYTNTNCSTANGRYPGPNAQQRDGWYSNSTAYKIDSATWSLGACRAKRQDFRPLWRYTQAQQDVSQFIYTLKNGTSLIDPTRLDGRTTEWDGCIEELDTSASSRFDIDDLPDDLNPDVGGSGSPVTPRWRPMWADVVWQRNSLGYEDSAQTDNGRENDGDGMPYGSDYLQSRGFAACGFPATTLAEMSASEVSNYVNNERFKPLGGTYHDVGMIWGVRMLSQNGVFASTTATWPGRNPPSRHIVFMTDGQMAPNVQIYGQYGVEVFDRRVTGGSYDQDDARHTARFLAVCEYARERLNMTVWVVALGTDLGADLRACASPGAHAFRASSKTELQNAFKTIATQVAMLRVSK